MLTAQIIKACRCQSPSRVLGIQLALRTWYLPLLSVCLYEAESPWEEVRAVSLWFSCSVLFQKDHLGYSQWVLQSILCYRTVLKPTRQPLTGNFFLMSEYVL